MDRSRTSPAKGILILLGFLAFMLLPALLATAEAQSVPETRRSKAAVAAHQGTIHSFLDAQGIAHDDLRLYMRIVKEASELTVYYQGTDGQMKPYKTYPICYFSGGLGPKTRQGDGKAPEGFYRVSANAMNPASSYHLSFNLGYPNRFDRAKGYTGNYLMVHGDCVSIGCYAMTDDVIEEIWTLMQTALNGGQDTVNVDIFPFEMTAQNLLRHRHSPHIGFWRSLAPAWTHFETTANVPNISTQNGTYTLIPSQ